MCFFQQISQTDYIKRGTSYIESRWERYGTGTNVIYKLQLAAKIINLTPSALSLATASNCFTSTHNFNLQCINCKRITYLHLSHFIHSVGHHVYKNNHFPSTEGTALYATATPTVTAALPSMSGTYVHNNITPLYVFTESTAVCTTATPTAALPSMSGTHVHNNIPPIYLFRKHSIVCHRDSYSFLTSNVWSICS